MSTSPVRSPARAASPAQLAGSKAKAKGKAKGKGKKGQTGGGVVKKRPATQNASVLNSMEAWGTTTPVVDGAQLKGEMDDLSEIQKLIKSPKVKYGKKGEALRDKAKAVWLEKQRGAGKLSKDVVRGGCKGLGLRA